MKEDNKMTAVEWLLEKYKSQNTLLFADDFEQAKEMEKQQIINAVDGFPIHTRHMDGEEYYNENYNK